MKTRKKELAAEVCRLKLELAELEREKNIAEELLSDALKANELGCKRGQYCCGCVHAVLVREPGRIKCYCTYGQCDHFKKAEGGVVYEHGIY